MHPYIMELIEKWLTRNEIAIPKVSLSSKINSDGDDVEVRADPSTSSLQVIDHAHHEVHDGNHYFVQEAVDLAINEVYDLRFTTPDTGEWAHLTFVLTSESELNWLIYEGVTISVSSTPKVPYNSNRNSSNTSSMELQPITNTSVANANSDTAVAAATKIAEGIIGAGKDGGFVGGVDEIVLKQNTDYTFRGIATAAGYISFKMGWYEHTDHH